MDLANRGWIMRNPALYWGLLFFLVFGGQFVIRYVRDNDFYILQFIFGTIGLLVMAIGLIMNIRNNKKSI
ncbi:hypothetical protein [Priestia megaterium]|uniref:hypothetical protein n=1 Tax=Priestia megaterium TaxID=1404 RepID=UPI00203D0EA0|nr:hypothetical protein [Priestia megaterium]MCM3186391.1 hypothetical protein [Priestia megaterium]